MLNDLVLFGLPGLQLEAFSLSASVIDLTVASVQAEGTCPRCGQISRRIHSRYRRQVADVPCAGIPVRWTLWARRFFCGNPLCDQTTFAERLPDVVAVWARRTQRLLRAQRAVGLTAGGEAGARLAHRLRMRTSPDSLLRLIRECPIEPTGPVHILGVDDWAWQRGQRYGTLLVDLERSQPVDLLPDRTAEALAHWLQAHPGIAVISRDRAGAYADGARRGAPSAVQVADRWHLLRNLADTLERLFDRLPADLRSMPPPEPSQAQAAENTLKIAASAVPSQPRPLTQPEQMRQARRTQRRERFETVRRLHQHGVSQSAIARQLQIGPNTIRRYLHASAFPEIAQRPQVPSILDPFSTYLTERWNAGCHNGLQLWREIREQGYRGSRQFLSRWVASQRQRLTSRPPPAAPRPLSSRRAAFLVLKPPEKLDPQQAATLARLCHASAEVATASHLAGEFAALLRGRQRDGLDQWLQTACASGLRELKNFADGLRRDYDAVAAGFSLPWSNGPTEGHINRLKLVKRQMYGRADFDLLRQRVLLRP